MWQRCVPRKLVAKSSNPHSAGDEQTAPHVQEAHATCLTCHSQALSGHCNDHSNEEQQPISHSIVGRVGKDAIESSKNSSKVPV